MKWSDDDDNKRKKEKQKVKREEGRRRQGFVVGYRGWNQWALGVLINAQRRYQGLGRRLLCHFCQCPQWVSCIPNTIRAIYQHGIQERIEKYTCDSDSTIQQMCTYISKLILAILALARTCTSLYFTQRTYSFNCAFTYFCLSVLFFLENWSHILYSVPLRISAQYLVVIKTCPEVAGFAKVCMYGYGLEKPEWEKS